MMGTGVGVGAGDADVVGVGGGGWGQAAGGRRVLAMKPAEQAQMSLEAAYESSTASRTLAPPAYVSIRQQTSAYVSVRQHTLTYTVCHSAVALLPGEHCAFLSY